MFFKPEESEKRWLLVVMWMENILKTEHLENRGIAIMM